MTCPSLNRGSSRTLRALEDESDRAPDEQPEINKMIGSITEGGFMSEHDAKNLSEPHRREVFLALVDAQDQKLSVPESRTIIASRFGISEIAVQQIEREGLDNNWPPL